jgi:hypothetical protein
MTPDPIARTILDAQSQAGHPARLRLSPQRLRRLRPDLFGWRGLGWRFIGWYFGHAAPRFAPKRFLEEQLWHGDARAAVVISTKPLRVAAYADELDCVAMLQLPEWCATEFSLSNGARLITVNSYIEAHVGRSDLMPGPHHFGRYSGFYPVLADLIADDREQLQALKREISEVEWRRAEELGRAYLTVKPNEHRDGRPAKSEFSAGARREAAIAAIVVVVVVVAVIAIVLKLS